MTYFQIMPFQQLLHVNVEGPTPTWLKTNGTAARDIDVGKVIASKRNRVTNCIV